MLRLSWIEIFLRLIPEMLLVNWGICVVAKQKISANKYIASSVIMGFVTFMVRKLPIYYGVHTFIILILTICSMAIIGLPIIKAMYGTLAMFTLLSFSELINVVLLDIFSINTSSRFTNVIVKSICGIPSIIIMLIVIKSVDYFVRKGLKLKNVNN
ncbi:hypothetical protein [Clostridium oryzae]|uniref:Uncharacterized protein n=1 Tax=Clostridium oryzae TaxID=1450648 RepID=A0A1V4IR59_9CLOT|nr:hypothetical protein [Clostridium oryzae]OPJ61957.1 hypothetical protein CLORY_20490 [Clostridium oryzae]